MAMHPAASVDDNYALDIHAWDIKFRRATSREKAIPGAPKLLSLADEG
jgi:hypothetical protein